MSATPFDRLANDYANDPAVAKSQMFGKPCLTVNGKTFMAWFRDGEMVFKLDDDSRRTALALDGAANWDPSGKGRPMKEWVAVPQRHSRRWRKLATLAYEYVASR